MKYLASPYTHDSQSVRESRFHQVCEIAAKLTERGLFIFSPIAHSHPIAMCGNLPTDWKYWEEYDRQMIAACDELIVAKIDGWEQSKGVTAEIKIANLLGIPVSYIEPIEEQTA
jgi:hypothetical protein